MNLKPTVHVIDDDDAVRDSLGMLLEVEGFIARTWASCVAFLQEARLDGNCCLLVDNHMPGMTGVALLEHLRRNSIVIPAIVMTGLPNTNIRHDVERVGAVLMEKPFHIGEVIRWVEAALGYKRSR